MFLKVSQKNMGISTDQMTQIEPQVELNLE